MTLHDLVMHVNLMTVVMVKAAMMMKEGGVRETRHICEASRCSEVVHALQGTLLAIVRQLHCEKVAFILKPVGIW